MDETQTLAVLALLELLDNPDRNDWDELVAANRAANRSDRDGQSNDAKERPNCR
jgi:hypothetical protein